MATTYVALWTEPQHDRDAFDREYWEIHVPLVRKVPGLRRIAVAAVYQGAFHRVAQLTFDSRDALEKALASPEFAALREDSARLRERYGNTVERIYMETEADETLELREG